MRPDRPLLGILLVVAAACASAPANLAEVAPVDPGEDCPAGGIVLSTGPDASGDGVLDASEVRDRRIVCVAPPLEPPETLVEVVQRPADEGCPGGAFEVRVGVDADGDAELDAEEVDDLSTFCPGPAPVCDDEPVLGDVVVYTALDLLRVMGRTTIEGHLVANTRTNLVDLSLLTCLESVGSLEIRRAEALRSLDGLGALREADRLVLGDLPVLERLTDFRALERLGAFEATQTSLVDVRGLERVTEMDAVTIEDNPLLQRLDGLDGLRSVGALRVRNNRSLFDIDALGALTEAESISLRGCALICREDVEALALRTQVEIRSEGFSFVCAE